MCIRDRLSCCCDAGFTINRAAVCACIPLDCQRNSCAAVITFAVAIRIRMVGVLRCAVAAGGAGFRALMLGIIRLCPRTVAIRMVCIVISACAAAGTGFASSVLCVRILAPRTGGIAVIAVVRCGISAGAADRRAAVLALSLIHIFFICYLPPAFPNRASLYGGAWTSNKYRSLPHL